MATATGGFSFGTSAATGTGLFGAAKPAAATPASSFTFGATATSAPTFGTNKLTTTAAAATTAPGFSFGGFGASTAGFGASTAAAATATPSTGLFSLSKPAATTASTGFSLFGAKTTPATTGLFGATSTTPAVKAVETKPLENPKEAMAPNELTVLVTNLEKHIKSQKDVKEEISKISTEGISTSRETITALKQSIALIANSLHRDNVAVENLKLEVGQELKNAEIAQRIKNISIGLHHDFAAPMEYFQRLVYSFETRINIYRREIEELETFISSPISCFQFTPQDLSNVLKRLNDSFIGLASELQQVHESAKIIKEKYLHFRRVMYNDSSDPFAARKKLTDVKGKTSLIGPSPFPVVQGAGIMASAFKSEAKASNLPTLSGLSSTFAKPIGTGLTRSLSFDGFGTDKSTTFGGGFGAGFGGGSSLFGKTSATSTSTFGTVSTSASPFTLQKPPSGKRGKLF